MDMIKMITWFAKEMGKQKDDSFLKEATGLKDVNSFIQLANSAGWRKAELSSGNFQGSARGCAKIASMMANKGESLMSDDAWNEMHAEPTLADNFEFPGGCVRSNFTKGGVNYFVNPEDAREIENQHFNKNREGYYGWFGFGGSIVEWHPELKIGFAFVPTFMNTIELVNERGS